MTIENILAWVVLGLLAGSVAKFLMPGRDPGGCVVTIVIGVIGALIGGFVGRSFFNFDLTRGEVINWHNFGIATAGSIVFLLIYRLLNNKG